MYKVIKNTTKEYKSTGGLKVKVPRSNEYSVYYTQGGHKIIVFSIPDYFLNPKDIGKALCTVLNTSKIKLDLSI